MEAATGLQPEVRQFLDKHELVYRVFDCNPEFADTAVFCEKYGFDPKQTCNTIITAGKTEPIKYACCVILATCKLDVNKKVCELLGIKKASFASSDQTIQLTGMQIGGVTPFIPLDVPIYIDTAVTQNEEVVFGGGNRSSKVILDPAELSKLPGAHFVDGLGLPR